MLWRARPPGAGWRGHVCTFPGSERSAPLRAAGKRWARRGATHHIGAQGVVPGEDERHRVSAQRAGDVEWHAAGAATAAHASRADVGGHPIQSDFVCDVRLAWQGGGPAATPGGRAVPNDRPESMQRPLQGARRTAAQPAGCCGSWARMLWALLGASRARGSTPGRCPPQHQRSSRSTCPAGPPRGRCRRRPRSAARPGSPVPRRGSR